MTVATGRRRTYRGRRRTELAAGADIPPLQWWRRLPPEAIGEDHLDILRRAFTGMGLIGEPRWADAVHPHPASAVAKALNLIKARPPFTLIIDLRLSMVFVAAIRGDAVAIAVLVAMIEEENNALTRAWRNYRRERAHDHDPSLRLVPERRARAVRG
ncbi:hypothetical protein MXD81_29525 [Microbacteriaceae bacterium K1510]|nr:hypothetical protein [Microbacteriaceae bacterium K1510]